MGDFLIQPWDIVFEKDKDGKLIELGRGAFGVVYRATYLETVMVAVKKITYKGHVTYETFKQEARAMKYAKYLEN